MKKRRNIYIDGENFVHTAASLLRGKKLIRSRRQLQDFDFAYLIDFVTRPDPIKPQKTYYYGAKLRVLKGDDEMAKLSSDMVKWNAKWVNALQRQGIDFVKCGNLKVRDGHKCRTCGQTDRIFIEKGVDVGLAVDVVSDALRRQVDEIVLFSADSDMLPAIRRAHGAGVKVIYAAFAGAINRALSTMVDEVWTYSEAQVLEAFKRVKQHE